MTRFMAGSVLLHVLLFSILLTPSGPREVGVDVIDMVTAQPVPLRRASPNPAPARPHEFVREKTAAREAMPVTAAAGGGEDGRLPQDEMEMYLSGMRERIDRHKVYPRISIARKEAGTVILRLTVQRDGSLSKLEVVEASRFPRLNDAALQAAAAAAPFGPLPADFRWPEWRINFPVKFALGGTF